MFGNSGTCISIEIFSFQRCTFFLEQNLHKNRLNKTSIKTKMTRLSLCTTSLHSILALLHLIAIFDEIFFFSLTQLVAIIYNASQQQIFISWTPKFLNLLHSTTWCFWNMKRHHLKCLPSIEIDYYTDHYCHITIKKNYILLESDLQVSIYYTQKIALWMRRDE